MSRSEMDQFVKSFGEAPDRSMAGQAGEAEVEPGQDRTFDPGRKIDNPLANAIGSGRVARQGAPVAEDAVTGNRQGGGSAPPPEYASRIRSYREAISRAARPAEGGPPAGKPPANPNPGGR